MFAWLKSEIMAMSSTDYLVMYCVLIGITGYLVFFSYYAFRRFRFMDATATSKIRSAAQGHVELKGLGEWMPNDTIQSPFSQSRCIWYHCTIDKRHRSGKRTTWTNISDQCSDHLFRLVDDTGECIVDPDHAHVVPESDKTWYGHSTDYRNQVPTSNSMISFGTGNYRFRERLIRPATPLYALGWFRTVNSDPSDEFISQKVEDLVGQWKLQPARYLRQYDLDANGKIQQNEWKAIYAAARGQVLAEIRKQKNEHHVLSRPENRRQPFILSALDEETLVSRKKMKAYGAIGGVFILFSALVIFYAIRAPYPV